ncbi:probable 3',5'-cyclic phosphodiesterase pde-5 isoform X2 [Mya arenaria]|uniref:probable 3',5'-cyclic phosphodiesterase pde-5 isoform X2 n=1 Tax=Mya arenaria TaxID=6604 RepID=UPI0022E3BD74|nr:probable 3',5'-cyclic phosphodiesterase pde-5 isoform X2 [Mya arenaria]XP_052776567.1 probable 3',5'-cyclic phosphodiesterase pde-5 isoform X2 [Mya arenaria]XP_052776568.1 probable 3',5'-cyclic phosphodiesterase pde-5 isoform X2 [Mya arenaria]XP_052776569.1 probable 3',5'-cyclic phosphodiesterase pde-5 isoform X2 [Mya arenaria]
MSNPVRQMKHRRLPPLPGAVKQPPPQKCHGNGSCEHTLNDEMPRKHLNHQDILSVKGFKLTSGSTSSLKITAPSSRASSASTRKHADLNEDQVIQYLHENPKFLEDYVLSHVNQERLNRWTAWKEQARRHRHGENLNGEIIPDRKATLAKWKASMHSKKWSLLQELTRDIHNHSNKAQVLAELANCIATATSAEGHNLYLIDTSQQQLYYQKPTNNNKSEMTSSCVGSGRLSSTLAGYVACTAETVRTGDILADDRFPDGLAVGGEKCQSVMGLPIIKGDGSLTGVIELYRNVGGGIFTLEDEEVAISMVMWADLCVEYVEMYNCMTRQRKLNEFLLAVTKSIFQDIVSMDTVIMKIMNYAKKLVNADRASLFLLDTNTNELYARIFDTGKIDENLPSKEIRFPMDKGVAGHVASTGEILNIADAYTDRRFNREVDMQTGYRTKSILCMPIYIRGNIIGVVQMVNKLQGTFTKSDEESFETFAVYCGLALHHAKLYEKIRRSEQKYKVALEVLSYHSQSSDDEFTTVKEVPVPDQITNITHYHFSPWAVTNMEKPIYVLYMFRDLFRRINSVRENEKRYDMDSLIRFTLTVRKNYRNVPYHNWDHAFSVAHAMYTVIKTSEHRFTAQECLALFVACLCHDLDHRGKTNAFMVKSASPLAAIYSTSTMEHHHFNQTVTILQNDGHNIFKHLSSEDYKRMLSDIRNSILATDLAMFFGNKAKLKDIADRNGLSWKDDEHRRLVHAIVMTGCDLVASAKPWKMQLDTVKYIFEEFYQQGDEEKAKGLTPMPMMDREKKHELPQLEVGFLVGICLPCYELMAQVLPETKPMKDGALSNMKKWKQLAEKPRDDVEAELSIDISERRHSLIQYGEHPEDDSSTDSEKPEDIAEETESCGEDRDTDVSGSSPTASHQGEDSVSDHVLIHEDDSVHCVE